MVDFLGFRTDVDETAKMCDVAVASSLREGLPVNIMEAMACGKPVIAMDNRGHRELIRDGVTGWLIKGNDENLFAQRLYELYKADKGKLEHMSCNAVDRIDVYSVASVMEEMKKIYSCYT